MSDVERMKTSVYAIVDLTRPQSIRLSQRPAAQDVSDNHLSTKALAPRPQARPHPRARATLTRRAQRGISKFLALAKLAPVGESSRALAADDLTAQRRHRRQGTPAESRKTLSRTARMLTAFFSCSFRSPPDEAPLNPTPPRQINRQFVARVSLVLAPAHLRQGQPRMVRTPRVGGMAGKMRGGINVLGEE